MREPVRARQGESRPPGRLGICLWVCLAALVLSGCRDENVGVVDLDQQTLDVYLEAYLVIGPAYRRAYEAGASPTAIPRQDVIREALDQAGWSWKRYQSVHASVESALLYLENPEGFRRLELPRTAAPEENVALVDRNYFEIKRARLIVEEENYGDD